LHDRENDTRMEQMCDKIVAHSIVQNDASIYIGVSGVLERVLSRRDIAD
jgi:hypothetical protein